MKVLVLDPVHEVLTSGLENNGFQLVKDYSNSSNELDFSCEGLIIRSRMKIDQDLIEKFPDLKFIARPGAGLENVDVKFAEQKGISVFRSPEGNRQAVAEQGLGMLLNLLNNFQRADKEVRKGIWLRKENRGNELSAQTVGLIGYGYMGKAFAKVLSGIGCKVIFFDILPNLSDEYATQVDWQTFANEVDIVSLHVPLTEQTRYLVNENWIDSFKKDIYLLNTARGECVNTKDLLKAINQGKIIGAALDVLEFEKLTFEEAGLLRNPTFQELAKNPKLLLTPHIAGWTHESNYKMSKVILDKILEKFGRS